MEVQGVTPSGITHVRVASARASGISKKGCNLELLWTANSYKGDPLYLASGPLKEIRAGVVALQRAFRLRGASPQ
eukprot:9250672-Pyramimonas_sp.AAC.1